MDKNKYLGGQRLRRQFRVRKRIRGSTERPRLCVFRSHRNLACQIIDDTTGKTLVAVGTKDKDVRADLRFGGNKAAAALKSQFLSAANLDTCNDVARQQIATLLKGETIQRQIHCWGADSDVTLVDQKVTPAECQDNALAYLPPRQRKGVYVATGSEVRASSSRRCRYAPRALARPFHASTPCAAAPPAGR